ncbi:hypothetical protein Tel_12860 [Candidatus Tenderia electrophaga]|jgi:aminoglycoside phosphotransferase family enzyme|uniref:Aminoglycoside phosphotransferase domain-containing protein n=1 Tax=Candidatus Tenderia electrophaga TaxID=1748243 RepID=A0A0S2TFQ3_9GAMM|nr:hypothetical protein Tel_12860 [Candidatus Tenderia electrophaga]
MNRSAQFSDPSIEDKVAALRGPQAYMAPPGRVEVKETHMSWVFLGEEFVYKLKKPVRYDFLDFSTLELRRRDCECEVELNRRLANGVYLGVVALRRQADGSLMLAPAGQVVDWLVKMRRLPAARMLDAAILDNTVKGADLIGVCRLLADFYRHRAASVAMAPDAYVQRFAADIEANLDVLGQAEYGLPMTQLKRLADWQRGFIRERAVLLMRRAQQARLVEGHGDLRPEHICLIAEPVVIDCLEFNRDLRILDPLDELAYLALECERLGAPALGARVLNYYIDVSGDRSEADLMRFYTVYRACLRATLAIWHTDDDTVDDHDKWRTRARDYLELALHHIDAS